MYGWGRDSEVRVLSLGYGGLDLVHIPAYSSLGLLYIMDLQHPPAEMQVSSEQILQEAFELRDEPLRRTHQSIQDLEELRSVQLHKRKEFEQQLNKNRLNFGQWLRYARWEFEHNHDFARARSIFERALLVNVQHIPFWTHYIKFELSHKNVNHARNLLDRAVTTLPRVDKLWFLYVQTEETLHNFTTVRAIFNRWLEWKPNYGAWDAYVNFEKRYDEFGNARDVFKRYVQAFPQTGDIWMKWINFEVYEVPKSDVQTGVIRNVFELAVDTLFGQNRESQDPKLVAIISRWSAWESSVKEYERASSIYQILLSKDSANEIYLSSEQRTQLLAAYTQFEKTYGHKDSIEGSIILKRRLKYEQQLKEDPQDFDTLWSLLNLLQQEQNPDAIRHWFSHIKTHKPPISGGKSVTWRRYVFLWIRYALWQEFEAQSIDDARSVWNDCLGVIPHTQFSFGKVWIHFAEFELRHDGLSSARKVLGRAIGQTCTSKPKKKILRYYIGLEKSLGEWNRCRKLYEKWLELAITSSQINDASSILFEYIEFEKELNEVDRVTSLYNTGLELCQVTAKLQTSILWISFIDFYKDEMRYNEARDLYKQLVAAEDTTRNWIAYAFFESSILSPAQLEALEKSTDTEVEFEITDTHKKSTRAVFQAAADHYKANKEDQNRLVILQQWKKYEEEHGTSDSLKAVESKLPTVVKRLVTVDGEDQETMELVFPEEPQPKLNKFLANAKKWAQATG